MGSWRSRRTAKKFDDRRKGVKGSAAAHHHFGHPDRTADADQPPAAGTAGSDCRRRTYAFPVDRSCFHSPLPAPEGSSPSGACSGKTQRNQGKKESSGKAGQAGVFRSEGCLDNPLAAYPAGAGTNPARDPHRSAGPLCHSRRGGRPRRGRQDLRYAGNGGLDRDAGSGTAPGDPASAHPCGRRF